MTPNDSNPDVVPKGVSFSAIRFSPWHAALLALFLLTAIFGAKTIYDYDLGYHLKGGQWILENHAFPSRDTYTYTVPERDYVDVHWLYQVSLYLLYRLGDYPLLSAVNVVLILLVFILVYLRLQITGAPLWMRVVLLAVALLASESRFQVRPEIVSWILMCLVLLVLELRVNRQRNLLFLLPLIQAVWVNVQGLSAIGWGLMLLVLASGFIHSHKFDKGLLKYTLLSLAACLLNPYFIRGALFPFTLLSTLGGDNPVKMNISEFQSPWFLPEHRFIYTEWYLAIYKFFSFFLPALLLATFKKRKLHEWLLAGGFFYLSAVAGRNIPLFMLSCAPLAAVCWKDLSWGWLRRLQASVLSRPWTAWALAVFFLGLCLRVATSTYYVSERRMDRFGLGLDMGRQPVQAARFLVDHGLDGRILNHMNAGGWLEWQRPQKVFVDGRLEVMGGEFFMQYVNATRLGGLASLQNKYNPDILFFNPDFMGPWLFDLRSMPQWRPVYLDPSAAIYLRQDYAPEVKALDDNRVLADWGVSPGIPKEASALVQMPRPSAFAFFWEGFFKPAEYTSGLNAIGNYYLSCGRYELAEAFYLEALKRTGGRYWNYYFNLGSCYYHAGRKNDALACFQRGLKEAPNTRLAKKMLEKFSGR